VCYRSPSFVRPGEVSRPHVRVVLGSPRHDT
jgi:hypothetical protein